jgi:hypothetical protein
VASVIRPEFLFKYGLSCNLESIKLVSDARWPVLSKRGPPGEEIAVFFSVHRLKTGIGEKLVFNMEEQSIPTQVIPGFVFWRSVLY